MNSSSSSARGSTHARTRRPPARPTAPAGTYVAIELITSMCAKCPLFFVRSRVLRTASISELCRFVLSSKQTAGTESIDTRMKRSMAVLSRVLLSVGSSCTLLHVFSVFVFLTIAPSEIGQQKDTSDNIWHHCSATGRMRGNHETPTCTIGNVLLVTCSTHHKKDDASAGSADTSDAPPTHTIENCLVTLLPLSPSQQPTQLHEATVQCLGAQQFDPRTVVAGDQSALNKKLFDVLGLGQTEMDSRSPSSKLAIKGSAELKDAIITHLATCLAHLVNTTVAGTRTSTLKMSQGAIESLICERSVFVDHLSFHRAITPTSMAINLGDHMWHLYSCASEKTSSTVAFDDLFSATGITLPTMPFIKRGDVIISTDSGMTAENARQTEAIRQKLLACNFGFCQGNDWATTTQCVHPLKVDKQCTLSAMFPYEYTQHRRVDILHRSHYCYLACVGNELANGAGSIVNGSSLFSVPSYTRPELTTAHKDINGIIQSIAHRRGTTCVVIYCRIICASFSRLSIYRH